jgi:hypothetical protein
VHRKESQKEGVAGCVVCDSVLHSVQRQPLADFFAPLHRKHSLERLCWPNADATKWGTPECHIEMAKLYASTLGDHTHAITKTDFSQLDGTALFNMIRWCESCDGSLQDPSAAAATARNRWGHEGAAQLSLSQEDYDEVIAGLRSLLESIAAVAVGHYAATPFTEALERISKIASTQHLLLPVLSCRRW